MLMPMGMGLNRYSGLLGIVLVGFIIRGYTVSFLR
jgi:hypothetical protein